MNLIVCKKMGVPDGLPRFTICMVCLCLGPGGCLNKLRQLCHIETFSKTLFPNYHKFFAKMK